MKNWIKNKIKKCNNCLNLSYTLTFLFFVNIFCLYVVYILFIPIPKQYLLYLYYICYQYRYLLPPIFFFLRKLYFSIIFFLIICYQIKIYITFCVFIFLQPLFRLPQCASQATNKKPFICLIVIVLLYNQVKYIF